MGINNFKKPINERAGVAEASLFYVDPIFSKVWNEFLEFYQSDEDELEEDYHLSYSRIKPYITDKISYVLLRGRIDVLLKLSPIIVVCCGT